MASPTNKIAAIGVSQILVWFRKRNCIPKNLPFGADCGMAASPGLNIFRNEAENAVTINSEHYNTMLADFILSEFEEIDTNDLYFQPEMCIRDRLLPDMCTMLLLLLSCGYC